MGITFNGNILHNITTASVNTSKSAPAAAIKRFIDDALDELRNLGGLLSPEEVKAYLRDEYNVKVIGAGVDAYIEGKISKINGEKVRIGAVLPNE